MSKAKLTAAKELIQEKEYDKARAILNSVDHPTAYKWLAKLDEIAPQKSKGFPTYLPWTIGIGSTVLIVLLLGIFIILASNTGSMGNGQSIESANSDLIGIWRNQNGYGATITYRSDGTGMMNGADPFAYTLVDIIDDIYLVEETNTGQYFYGSTSIRMWRRISDNEMLLETNAPVELYTPGMSVEELKVLSDEFDMEVLGFVDEPSTWKLVTRLTD